MADTASAPKANGGSFLDATKNSKVRVFSLLKLASFSPSDSKADHATSFHM